MKRTSECTSKVAIERVKRKGFYFLWLFLATMVGVSTLNFVLNSRIIDKFDFQISITPEPPHVRRRWSKKALEVWHEYKRLHSEEALQRELQTFHGPSPDRKFAIAHYTCPLQAGNRMQNFLNSVLWSVVTNRTVLWKYYTKSECQKVGKDWDGKICRTANTESDCAAVLSRSPFFPSHDYWQNAFNLPEPTMLSKWTTFSVSHPTVNTSTDRFWFEGAEKENGIVDTLNDTVVIFPMMFTQLIEPLKDLQVRSSMLSTEEARSRVVRLLSQGSDFVYGLVLYDTFAIQPEVSVPPRFPNRAIVPGPAGAVLSRDANELLGTDNPISTALHAFASDAVHPTREGITIVMHSRHIQESNDGSTIDKEMHCFDGFLGSLPSSDFCQVVLLSDRELTLEGVGNYVKASYPQCHVLVAPHDAATTSFRSEHGPFAGAGFYQDLSMVANQVRFVPTTRTAFVGEKRSSSLLVKETIAYELSRQDQYQSYKQPKLERCFLNGARDL